MRISLGISPGGLSLPRMIGAKFVDQYLDDRGEYWVLTRAPIDCVLDVAEGVLLSYRLEEELEEAPGLIETVLEQIESRVIARAISYDRGPADLYGAPRPVEIPNASFEEPAIDIAPGGGRGLLAGDWQTGSTWFTWFGRLQWEGGVPDGERAVWSSVWVNGSDPSQGMNPDNGFYQVLAQEFRPGRYTLSVMASGDNSAGLTSRLSLGYGVDEDRSVTLVRNDVEISYTPTDDRLPQPDDWQRQELILEIPEGSPAVGRPIWVKLSSVTDSSGPGGGNSNWWDDLRLSYQPLLREYASLMKAGPATYRVEPGAINIDGDPDEWSRIPVYFQDALGDARGSGVDLHYIKSAMDDEKAYFLFVCADEAWQSDLTLEVNFDYAPGRLAHESHGGATTDLHTNIREREANFWQNTSHRGTPHDPGVRLRRRGAFIEFSVPLKRYEADYFAIVYANIWLQGASNPSDQSRVEM